MTESKKYRIKRAIGTIIGLCSFLWFIPMGIFVNSSSRDPNHDVMATWSIIGFFMFLLFAFIGTVILKKAMQEENILLEV